MMVHVFVGFIQLGMHAPAHWGLALLWSKIKKLKFASSFTLSEKENYFFYICDVITSPEKEKSSANHYFWRCEQNFDGVNKILTVWSKVDGVIKTFSVWTNVYFLEIVWSHRVVWSFHMFFCDVMGRLVHTCLGSLSLEELSGSWNGNPLVDVRTVARHADARGV